MSDSPAVGRGVFVVEKAPAPDALDETRARLRRLEHDIRRAMTTVRGRDAALAALRLKAAGLRAALVRSREVPRAAAPAPSRGLPRAAAPKDLPWAKALPYGVLALLGLWLGSRVGGVASAPRTASPPLAVAAAPISPASEDAGGALALTDEEAMDQAISLVYAYRPPGLRRTVQDILWPELEASADSSAWVATSAGGSTYLVTFRPYGEALDGQAPVYEFEVDLEAETVVASPETLQSLGAETLALAPPTRP